MKFLYIATLVLFIATTLAQDDLPLSDDESTPDDETPQPSREPE